ncbi:hypothetical protein SLS58_006004 [Diplodia intermedia]|uniref:Uncharacterized protein n=1 Tax=Diplodia intermedia TaxID=856260 RepID=A0ABR3TPQ0_9PEZI
MAPFLAPLPIFGIALTATAIVTLVILHIWHSRLEHHRSSGSEIQSTDCSPFDEECGLQDRDKFRGTTVSVAPGQPTRGRVWTAAKVQGGDLRNAEMGIDLGDLRSTTQERSRRYGYHITGARDDAGDNPYDGAGGDSTVHHGCDLADVPLHQPYANYRHDTTRNAHGSSPLRYGVTVSTITTELDASSVRESMSNNTLRPLSRDEIHQERGRRSSLGRSISNLSTNSSTRSKSAKRMSSRKSVSPLEVHPWRMSYS